MDTIGLFLLMAGLLWALFAFLRRGLSPKPEAPATPPPTPGPAPANMQAKEAIQRVIDTCNATGGDAFDALIICAAADGKVSRDELRIITWFCSFRGAQFSNADLAQIDALNTGVSMKINSETTAERILADLAPSDAGELIRLYAAISAIRKPWARPSKPLNDTLAMLESRLALKS